MLIGGILDVWFDTVGRGYFDLEREGSYLVLVVGVGGDPFPCCSNSPLSSCLRSRNSAAASRILLNSMQNACTSMNSSPTLIILFRIKLCKNTQTKRTNRFCMYLSFMVSHVDIQLDMYR